MVKGEEESRWHRRKSRGLTDEEIQEFLNDMAAKLRVSNRFVGHKIFQIARVMVKDGLAPRVRGRDLGITDAQWTGDDSKVEEEEIVQLMKDAFGISAGGSAAMINRAESILTTMSVSGFRRGGSRSPRDRRRARMLQKVAGPFAENSDYREGAALFFLGPELFCQFLEETHE